MSLGIADVAAVIGIAVERTRPGRPVTGSSGRYGSLIKRIHLFLIIGKKANVKAITDAGRFAIDRHLHPELRVLLAIGHGIRMLHNNADTQARSEEHTSELQSREKLVCRLLLEKKKIEKYNAEYIVQH